MTQAGVFVGNDPNALADYGKWVGKTPDNVLNYMNNSSWAAFDSSVPWEVGLWKNSASPSIWSVPLTVNGTSLEDVATGKYNDHFLKAAQALASTKPSSDGSIYIRVGWEFNGSWMPWSAGGHEQAFIKSFQELVDTFRSVSNKFKFVWDVNEQDSNYNPELAYPGDKYVDVVGMDTYYNTAWDSKDPMSAFKHNVETNYGLQWQQDFAAKHGKATAISEWGVMSNDAAPYLQAMTKWMTDHKMVYENYWDSNADFRGQVSKGQYPGLEKAFKDAVASLQHGSDHSAPTTPTAPSTPTPSPTPTAPSPTPTAPSAPSAPATPPAPVGNGSGSDKLTFRVSEDAYNGDAKFVVKVDGKQVGDVQTAHASHGSGQWENVNLSGDFHNAKQVSIEFTNDEWAGGANDRNLYVDGVNLNGKWHDATEGRALADGAIDQNSGTALLYHSNDGVTWTTSTTAPSTPTSPSAPTPSPTPTSPSPTPAPTTPTTPVGNGSGSDKLTFRVSEDAFRGDAKFVVKVDGKQVGDIQTAHASHGSGQWENISVKGDFDHAKQVSLEFINDAWVSGVGDRNLYVDGVDLNGKWHDASTAHAVGQGVVDQGAGVANMYHTHAGASWDL